MSVCAHTDFRNKGDFFFFLSCVWRNTKDGESLSKNAPGGSLSGVYKLVKKPAGVTQESFNFCN